MIPHQKIQIKNLLTDSTTVIHQEIHDSWLVKYIKNTDRNSVSVFYICLMLNEHLYQHKRYHQ